MIENKINIDGIVFAKVMATPTINGEFEAMYEYISKVEDYIKRVSYFQSYTEAKPSRDPPFSSVYICQNILPRTIMFNVIDKKGDLI